MQFDAGPEWKIEYQGEKVDFFNLTRPKGENVFFILSRWPVGGGLEQIPHYIEKIAARHEQGLSGRLLSLLWKEGYVIEDISGIEFSGQAAVFTSWDSTVQAIFMVSEGDGIWDGQYNGSRANWAEAKTVLERIRKP